MKILIVDDENKTRALINKMILSLFPEYDFDISTDGRDVLSALQAFKSFQPDLILLDIKLPDGTGFDFLELIEDRNFKIIFITAHDEYAIKAIKMQALDYLLKPIDVDELKSAIIKAKEIHFDKADLNVKYQSLLADVKKGHKDDNKILIKTRESLHLIKKNEIIRCESFKNYTTIILKDNKKIVTSKNITDYESLLVGSTFVKVHRSHIVNLDYLDRYEKLGEPKIVLSNSDEVPVSRANRDLLIDVLEGLGKF